ncbi:unnamed protein product [Knipowitschia caucasica]
MWLLNLDYLLILCGLFFVLCTSYRTIEQSVRGAGALPRLTFTRSPSYSSGSLSGPRFHRQTSHRSFAIRRLDTYAAKGEDEEVSTGD